MRGMCLRLLGSLALALVFSVPAYAQMAGWEKELYEKAKKEAEKAVEDVDGN